MSQERPFFKGSDTSFGMFYPTDYFIAVFETLSAARAGEQALFGAGYTTEDVRTFDSEYVKADMEERLLDADWIDSLLQKVSIGKESHFWHEDLKAAGRGAGFLAIFCPSEDEARRIVAVLRPLAPQTMRRYRTLAIETFDPGLNPTFPGQMH